MRVNLLRRVLTRLYHAGIDAGDGSGIRLVKRHSTNDGLYEVPADVLIRAAEHYRGLIVAGALDQWETRDGEKLIRLAESELIDQ